MPYHPGRRAVVKVKQWENEDLVVGRFLGPPKDPACLLVGAFDAEGALRYMGWSARPSPGLKSPGMQAAAETQLDRPWAATATRAGTGRQSYGGRRPERSWGI